MVTRCGYWGWILGLTALLSSTDRALSDDSVSVGGSFLTFYAKAMTFPDAVATCAKIGAHVVNDDDPLVHAYLTKNGALRVFYIRKKYFLLFMSSCDEATL